MWANSVLPPFDGTRTARFDTVIFATGRRASTRDMGLEAAGVALDARGFVQVDGRQDTNIAGIHAVGDVTGQAALTPVAIAAARRHIQQHATARGARYWSPYDRHQPVA